MLAETDLLPEPKTSDAAPVEHSSPDDGEPPSPKAGETAPATTAEAPPAQATQPSVSAGEPEKAGATQPMAEGETTTTEPPPKPEPPVHHRQSQVQVALLEDHALLLEGLEGADDAFKVAMVEYALTPERFAANAALNVSANDAIGARLQAVAVAVGLTADQNAAFIQVRSAHSGFRQIARTAIRDEAGRIALGLDERMSGSMTTYANSAKQALTAALAEPYATLLAIAGYDAERITSIITLIDAFNLIAAQHRAAQEAAERATIVRDAAVAEVRVAYHQLKVEVRTILRRYPHLRPPVGI